MTQAPGVQPRASRSSPPNPPARQKVEADNGQDHVPARRPRRPASWTPRLRVGDDPLVVDPVKLNVSLNPVRMVPPDFVHPGDEFRRLSGRAEIPVADLVLLGVGELLGPRRAWHVLLQFERGAVDAVVGQRCSEHQAGEEGGTPAVCSCSGKMSGVVGQKLGRK